MRYSYTIYLFYSVSTLSFYLHPNMKITSRYIPEMFVALYADETVPYKEIVKILNIANENKFKMVLATRPQK